MDEWILDDLLECSVCLERLDTSSKVLPCQHTFCKKCLEEILRTHLELRCPECRIVVDTKIDDLPPNVLLMRILEGLGGASRRTVVRGGTSVIYSGTCTQGSAKSSNLQQQNCGQQHSMGHQPVLNPEAPSVQHPLYQNQPCARATYDYHSKEPGDLSFKKGDVILLRKKLDSNWYHGECNGNQGVFPLRYVQIVVPLPSIGQAQCKALYDFKMVNDEEDGCLAFHKGDIITVMRRVDENWAEGKLGDKIGIFPLAFVEMNSVAKALIKAHLSENQAGPSRVVPPAPTCKEDGNISFSAEHSQVTPLVGLPATSDSSSNSLTSPSSSCSSTTPTTSSSHSSPSSPPPPPAPNKRHSFGTTVSQSGSSIKLNRHSAEILNIPEGFPGQTGHNVDISPEQHIQLVRHGSQRHRRINSTEIPPPANQLQHSSLQLPAAYVALYPYKPQKGDELELKRGGVYTVTERCQDGWFKGTAARGQKAGVFPGNYVAPAKSLPALQAQVRGLCRSSGSSVTGSPRNGTPPVEPRSLVTYTKAPTPTSSANVLAPQGQTVEPTRNQAQQTDHQTVSYVHPVNASTPSTVVKPVDKLQLRDKKEKCGVSLMRRLASMKKSKSPPPTPYSLDNPVFEDMSVPQHVHIRSGSCPNQLLTSTNVETPHRIFSPTSSHRSKQRERPSISRIAPRMSTERSPPTSIEHRKCNSMDSQTIVTPQDLTSITVGIGRMGEEESIPTRTVENVQPVSRISHHDFSSTHEHPSSRQINPESTGGQNPRLSCESSVSNGETKVSGVMRRHGDLGHEQKPQNPPRSSTNTGMHKMFAPPKNQSTSHHVRERFRCIVPYPPNSEYELELRLGDVIYVHKKREDGWYKGTQQRTGRTGLFPASFVQSF